MAPSGRGPGGSDTREVSHGDDLTLKGCAGIRCVRAQGVSEEDGGPHGRTGGGGGAGLGWGPGLGSPVSPVQNKGFIPGRELRLGRGSSRCAC